FLLYFLFMDPATTLTYTLSLHDALPIFEGEPCPAASEPAGAGFGELLLELGEASEGLPDRLGQGAVRLLGAAGSHDLPEEGVVEDRKSTRLNSSHVAISYAVFCLKKKKL